MKKIPSIIIVVWGIAVLCTLFMSSCKRPEVLDNSTLVNSARNVALTFGPAYVPFFKEANVSDVQVFKKEDYGDSRPQIRKQIGRKFYTVTFTYDSTAVKFDFGFAARVRIWKDTGEPLDVIFGNGWGRNFFFLSFKEPITHQMTMRKWLLTLLLKYHCKLYMNQRLFGTTIVTNKMNGYDNKPVLMK